MKFQLGQLVTSTGVEGHVAATRKVTWRQKRTTGEMEDRAMESYVVDWLPGRPPPFKGWVPGDHLSAIPAAGTTRLEMMLAEMMDGVECELTDEGVDALVARSVLFTAWENREEEVFGP